MMIMLRVGPGSTAPDSIDIRRRISRMNCTARAALIVPFLALPTAGAFTSSCRGGGTIDGLDGSFDGQAVRLTAKGELCEQAMVSIDDDAADSTSGCVKDEDCTVRVTGDYCACPSTPRAILAARAAAFDEGLEGITKRCTCQIAPCEPVQPSRAQCRDGRCALAGE
jgi:hypothetical protein